MLDFLARKGVFFLLGLLGLGSVSAAVSAAQVPRGKLRPPHAPQVLRVPAGFPSIQAAIDTAHNGDVVLVAPGTYRENLDFRGKAIEVVAPQGAGRTILRAAVSGPVVRFWSGEGPDSMLMGFQIRGGSADFSAAGGGLSCMDPDGQPTMPHVTDCVIASNFSDLLDAGPAGAGVGGDPILERCILRDNHAFLWHGGAVYGAPTMFQCVVEDNDACNGGGLYLFSGARIESTIVRRNLSGPCQYHGSVIDSYGGGVFVAGTGVTLVGCVLQGNSASGSPAPGDPADCSSIVEGGALHGSGATLRHCTVLGNHAEHCSRAGGLGARPTVIDSIVRANEDPPGYYQSATGFRFSNVDGSTAGVGCIDADPLFVDPTSGDLRLHDGSPCIDAGDPASPLEPDGSRTDQGAFPHFRGATPVAAVWQETGVLAPENPGPGSAFGSAVALSGDTALVGARNAGSDGEAHVFRRQGGVWTHEARLDPIAGGSGAFGTAVALRGNVAVVSAPREMSTPGFFGGALYVFERTAPDQPFTTRTRLVADQPANGENFGTALALDGGFLAVGCPYEVFEGSIGRVLLFQRLARGRWVQVAELTSSAPQPFDYSTEFGASLALSGTTLVVGEWLRENPVAFGYAGRVYVYEHPGRSPYSWVLVRELSPPTEAHDGFGLALALAGDSLLIGTKEETFAYERGGPGLPWERAMRIDQQSLSLLQLDGNRAWVSGRQPSSNVRQVREFQRSVAGAPWVRTSSFDTLFAEAIAGSGNTLLSVPGSAQGGRVFTRGFQLDTVVLDQAAEAEAVRLTGQRLDEVSTVRIDGEAQPIESQSPALLVIRPAPRAPGFGELSLEGAGGPLVLSGGLESLPSLSARSSGVGGTLEVALNNGEAGAFALFSSLDLRPTPLVLTNPPTWFALFLSLDPKRSNVLATDTFPNSGRASRSFLLPNDPQLIGLTLHVQALCQRGLFGPARYSFTNLADVTF